jgi:hypothetical protein
VSFDPFHNGDASSITVDVVGVLVVPAVVMHVRRIYRSRVSYAALSAARGVGEGSGHDRLIYRAGDGVVNSGLRLRHARVNVPAEVALLFLQKLRRRDGLLRLDVYFS